MPKRFNFTKSEIDLLPLPEKGKRADYQDSKVSSLYLRVSHTGVKTYSVLKRTKTGLERLTLGRYPHVTIEQARRQATQFNIAIAEGLNPAQKKRAENQEKTFADLFHQFIERHAKINKKTWDEDVQRFNHHLAESIGAKKLSRITRADISTLHGRITTAGHNTAANRTVALISSVFNWGIDAGLVENNPAHGIRKNREKSRERFLQGDELPRFFGSLSVEPNTTIRDYVLISLLTGARKSNVCAMQWKDINFDRAEWRIIETKNGTPQTVALSPEAMHVLINRKPSECAVFVFPGRGKSMHLEEPKKAWKRILERAKIEDLRIHDLRRTLGSWQAKTGASMAIIGKSLNHKNQNTTAIYARLDIDPVRDSVNTATSAMLTAAGLKDTADIIKIKKKI